MKAGEVRGGEEPARGKWTQTREGTLPKAQVQMKVVLRPFASLHVVKEQSSKVTIRTQQPSVPFLFGSQSPLCFGFSIKAY